MATPTAKLGLVKPTTADPFVTADLAANWQKLDDAPGSTVCTSTTRPTGWNTNQTGRKILETDTGLGWWWSGTAWKRVAPMGLLKTTGGNPAIALRTSDATTSSSSTFAMVQAVSNVVVPDGTRPIKVTCNWRSSGSDSGIIVAAIFRNATAGAPSDSGNILTTWDIPGHFATQDSAGGGGTFVYYERNGLAAGVYSWSLQFRSSSLFGGGSSSIRGTSQGPITISVEEV